MALNAFTPELWRDTELSARQSLSRGSSDGLSASEPLPAKSDRLPRGFSYKAELINLYFKLVKLCSYSFVDVGSNLARRDRNSDEFNSDRRKSFYLTTREFGLFSSSEACFKHYRCIL